MGVCAHGHSRTSVHFSLHRLTDVVDKLTNKTKKGEEKKGELRTKVPVSEVHRWFFFFFFGEFTEIRLHDLFFLANKEAWLLLKGCLVLPGSRECAFQQADRVKHVRRRE